MKYCTVEKAIIALDYSSQLSMTAGAILTMIYLVEKSNLRTAHMFVKLLLDIALSYTSSKFDEHDKFMKEIIVFSSEAVIILSNLIRSNGMKPALICAGCIIFRVYTMSREEDSFKFSIQKIMLTFMILFSSFSFIFYSPCLLYSCLCGDAGSHNFNMTLYSALITGNYFSYNYVISSGSDGSYIASMVFSILLTIHTFLAINILTTRSNAIQADQ